MTDALCTPRGMKVVPSDPAGGRARLNTETVRSVYHIHTEAEPWGYKDEDFIGHQVLNTITGLCDEVDYLRRLAQECVWRLKAAGGGTGAVAMQSLLDRPDD